MVGVQGRKYASQEGSRLFVHIRLSTQCSSQSRTAADKDALKSCFGKEVGPECMVLVTVQVSRSQNPSSRCALIAYHRLALIFRSAALIQLQTVTPRFNGRHLKSASFVGLHVVICSPMSHAVL